MNTAKSNTTFGSDTCKTMGVLDLKKFKHFIKCGNILEARWGFDQANYYRVVRLVGKQSIEVVELGQCSIDTGYPFRHEDFVPATEEFGDKLVLRRVSRENEERILNLVCNASLKKYFVIENLEFCGADHYTANA